MLSVPALYRPQAYRLSVVFSGEGRIINIAVVGIVWNLTTSAIPMMRMFDPLPNAYPPWWLNNTTLLAPRTIHAVYDPQNARILATISPIQKVVIP